MTDISPAMDYFGDNHICLSVLVRARGDMEKDDENELAGIGTMILDASLRAFETSLIAFVRGVFIGRSSAGQAQTNEESIIDVIHNCICNDCFVEWFTLRDKCCLGHAVRELIETMAVATPDDFSLLNVPVSHTQNPELN